MLTIEINNDQASLAVDEERLRQAVENVLLAAGIATAEVSVAIVDDATIHRLNVEFLEHDYPTDVLSFLLERSGDQLEGEIIASADTATRNATQYGWSAADELLLYVIHGALHLVGHDDATDELEAVMRAAEAEQLGRFGLEPHY
ncbi:MAG TPA: rRNA maturation RNase YbeY [Pirellulales bacterium]|jgi:probable rRNA maturation factor|nr:rRNA maturation RNase YbeY [Pirellulales bacterium]